MKQKILDILKIKINQWERVLLSDYQIRDNTKNKEIWDKEIENHTETLEELSDLYDKIKKLKKYE